MLNHSKTGDISSKITPGFQNNSAKMTKFAAVNVKPTPAANLLNKKKILFVEKTTLIWEL
uniref:Uncharacterized protein n=1 Tax=Romanomermis culicivorax TaxID=13658 RepID=A0A915J7N0_ROMCU